MIDKFINLLSSFLHAGELLYKAFDAIKGFFKNKEYKE